MKQLGFILVIFWKFRFVFGMFQMGSLQGSKQATFDRFDGVCPGLTTPITYELNSVKVEGSKMILNTTFTVKEDILGEPWITVTVKRCKFKENLDTCEGFRNFKTNKYCTFVVGGSDLWSPFFSTFTPPWRCPIKKGIYRGYDSVIDMAAFLFVTNDDWFWRIENEILQKRTNRKLMCLFIEAHIIANSANKTNTKGQGLASLGTLVG